MYDLEIIVTKTMTLDPTKIQKDFSRASRLEKNINICGKVLGTIIAIGVAVLLLVFLIECFVDRRRKVTENQDSSGQ